LVTAEGKVMALYKDKDYLNISGSEEFDKEHRPGDAAPFSGIYRCMGCGREVASNEQEPLPPQNHHQHPQQTAIRWKMVVYANHKPK
jgi:hypothetical protein